MEFPDGLDIGATLAEAQADVGLRRGELCYRRAHRVVAPLLRSAVPFRCFTGSVEQYSGRLTDYVRADALFLHAFLVSVPRN